MRKLDRDKWGEIPLDRIKGLRRRGPGRDLEQRGSSIGSSFGEQGNEGEKVRAGSSFTRRNETQRGKRSFAPFDGLPGEPLAEGTGEEGSASPAARDRNGTPFFLRNGFRKLTSYLLAA